MQYFTLFFLLQSLIRKELVAIETDPLLDPIERAQRKQSLYEAYSNLSSTSPSNVNGICLNNNTNSGLDLSPLTSHFRYNNDNIDSVLGKLVLRFLFTK